jgi:hypothetical protein
MPNRRRRANRRKTNTFHKAPGAGNANSLI